MTSSKHPKTHPGDRPRDDLAQNPGIGSSKGAFSTGEDPDTIRGGSTSEGDVANDATPQGGVDPDHMGRTNK